MENSIRFFVYIFESFPIYAPTLFYHEILQNTDQLSFTPDARDAIASKNSIRSKSNIATKLPLLFFFSFLLNIIYFRFQKMAAISFDETYDSLYGDGDQKKLLVKISRRLDEMEL